MDLTHSLHLECKKKTQAHKTDDLIASGRHCVNKWVNFRKCALTKDKMSSSVNPSAINKLDLTLSTLVTMNHMSHKQQQKPQQRSRTPLLGNK